LIVSYKIILSNWDNIEKIIKLKYYFVPLLCIKVQEQVPILPIGILQLGHNGDLDADVCA